MDHGLVFALVHAWIVARSREFLSYVRPYQRIRWSPKLRRLTSVSVGGHMRMRINAPRPGYARLVCKFEPLCGGVWVDSPFHVSSGSRDEEGRVARDRRQVTVT